MKKTFRLIGIVLIMIVAVFCAVSCKKDGGNDGPIFEELPSEEKTLGFSVTSLDMLLGDEVSLVASYTTKEGAVLQYGSSNTAIATVDANGKVTAVGLGEAKIQASYGEEKAEIPVSVGLGEVVPTLSFPYVAGTEFTTSVSTQISLIPVVNFNGKTFAAEQLIFDQTNKQVANIENGVFKPKAKGTTEVTVSCKFQGKEFSTLTRVFRITTQNSVELQINGQGWEMTDNIELYTRGEFAGKKFATSAPFDVKLTINGEEVVPTVSVTGGGISYSSVDKTIAVATGATAGDNAVNITYNGKGENIDRKISVSVNLPLAEYKTKDAILFSLADKATEQQLPVEEMFGASATLTRAEYSDGTQITVESGKLTGFDAEKADLGKERKIKVYTADCGYEITVKPCTKVIRKAEDLECFKLNDITVKDNGAGKATEISSTDVFDGYYILGGDIDASEYEHQVLQDSTKNKTLNGVFGTVTGRGQKVTGGFTGVLDGAGHKISGLTVINQGLFGIMNGGVVKNIAFVDVTLKSNVRDNNDRRNVALFAQNVYGGEFENVYIKTNGTIYGGGKTASHATDAGGNRALVATFMSGYTDEATQKTVAVKFKDCVFEYDVADPDVQYCFSYGLYSADLPVVVSGSVTSIYSPRFENVYVISGSVISVGNKSNVLKSNSCLVLAENETTAESKLQYALDMYNGKLISGNETEKTFDASKIRIAEGVKRYATLEDMKTDKDNNTEGYEKLSSDYWSVSDDGVVSWKSAVSGGGADE